MNARKPVQSTYHGRNIKGKTLKAATNSRDCLNLSQNSHGSSKASCLTPNRNLVLKSFIYSSKFESLQQASLFPPLQPKSQAFYSKLYLKLDQEQALLNIKEQLSLINPYDAEAAIEEALDRGLLTNNKINKILSLSQTQPKRNIIKSQTA